MLIKELLIKKSSVTKRRSKVQEKNTSYERVLDFDQWKTFSEKYKPMRVWFWLVYKFAENYSRSWFFSEFIQTQMRYSTSLDKRPILIWRLLDILIKLKFFLWTKLQENLLLAKYLISVSAPLSNGVCIPFRGSHSF